MRCGHKAVFFVRCPVCGVEVADNGGPRAAHFRKHVQEGTMREEVWHGVIGHGRRGARYGRRVQFWPTSSEKETT